jgi:hypothetical protein
MPASAREACGQGSESVCDLVTMPQAKDKSLRKALSKLESVEGLIAQHPLSEYAQREQCPRPRSLHGREGEASAEK